MAKKLHTFMDDQSTGMDTCLCGKPRTHETHHHKYHRLHTYLVVNVCECSMPEHSACHDNPEAGEKRND